jgi:uncharacterized membrane protein YdfJ with MMPL/SSD domain
MLVNISLTPAMLLMFPNFFARSVEPFHCCGRTFTYGLPERKLTYDSRRHYPDADPLLSADYYRSMSATPNASAITNATPGDNATLFVPRSFHTPELIAHAHDEERHSRWYQMGSFLVYRRPWNLLVMFLCIGSVVPFAFYCYQLETSSSLLLYMPRNDALTTTFEHMCRAFGEGRIYPYKLLMAPSDEWLAQGNRTVLSQDFFTQSTSMLQRLAQLPRTSPDNFAGFSFAYGREVPYFFVQACLDSQSNESICLGIQYAVDTFVSTDRRAAWYLVSLSFDPQDQQGFEWLQLARVELRNFSAVTGWELGLSGIGSDVKDAIDTVYDRFPLMIGVTIGVVLLFVAVAFRSVLIPIRSIFTVALTIAFVYGFAILVYQKG